MRQTVIRELFERIRESFPRPSHFGCGPLPVILSGQLPQGCLAVAVPVRLEQFQIGRRIAAQTPTEHHAVRRSGGQIAGMAGHQIQHGQSWNHGHFPRSIDLDLGDRLQSGLFRIAPMGHCPRPRPDSRQRILAHGRGDSATLDRQRHSLTDISQHDFGRRRMISRACESSHPQSQTSTRASGLPARTPSEIAVLTSAISSA